MVKACIDTNVWLSGIVFAGAPTEPSGATETLEMKKAAGLSPAAVSNFGFEPLREGSSSVSNGALDP